MSVSDKVGCGWMLHPMSDATAPISIASTPSATNSPAPTPAVLAPSTRSVSGVRINFVTTSLRNSVVALPDGPHGNRHTSTERFSAFARFGQSTPLDFRISRNDDRNRPRMEGSAMASDYLGNDTPFMGCFLCQHRFTYYIAHSINRQICRPPLGI